MEKELIESIMETTGRQLELIDKLAGQVQRLSKDLEDRPTKKTTYLLGVVLNAITVIILVVLLNAFSTNTNTIVAESHKDSQQSTYVKTCNQEKILVLLDNLRAEPYGFRPFKECVPYLERTLPLQLEIEGGITIPEGIDIPIDHVEFPTRN